MPWKNANLIWLWKRLALHWHIFCDSYLEAVKDRLYRPEIYGKKRNEQHSTR